MIDVVVLAGGTDRGVLAAQTGVCHRPLLEVAGKPIILRVLAALSETSSIDRVALVAPPPVLEVADELTVDLRLPAGDGFLDNLLRGIAATTEEHLTTPPGHVLVITGDLPLITGAAIDDLTERALSADADVVYPIIPKVRCEEAFPGGRRTYLRLREGVFTGGNAVVMRRAFAERSQVLIAHLYASRKSPIRLARLFGPGFILGLLLGRLAIEALERRASAIAGARVRAIISEHPELGFDVDKMEDLVVAREAAARVLGTSPRE